MEDKRTAIEKKLDWIEDDLKTAIDLIHSIRSGQMDATKISSLIAWLAGCVYQCTNLLSYELERDKK